AYEGAPAADGEGRRRQGAGLGGGAGGRPGDGRRRADADRRLPVQGPAHDEGRRPGGARATVAERPAAGDREGPRGRGRRSPGETVAADVRGVGDGERRRVDRRGRPGRFGRVQVVAGGEPSPADGPHGEVVSGRDHGDGDGATE